MIGAHVMHGPSSSFEPDVSNRSLRREVRHWVATYLPLQHLLPLFVYAILFAFWIFLPFIAPAWATSVFYYPGGVAFFIAYGFFVQYYVACQERWRRVANAPAEAIAKGDCEQAKQAFQKALHYAQQLSSGDRRRGQMLHALAQYLQYQGRRNEARNLFEECIPILGLHHSALPDQYLSALNNYSAFLIASKEYGLANRLLKKAVDSIPLAKKSDSFEVNTMFCPEEWEFLLRLRFAELYIAANLLQHAEVQLQLVEPIVAKFNATQKQAFHDSHLAVRCSWKCSVGEHADAGKELQFAIDPDAVLYVRAKICIKAKKHASAEWYLRRAFSLADELGTLHLPEHLRAILDLAEAQFGQAKHDDAFATLQDARSIVADFALPADDAWRKALTTWHQRATDLGRTELAASLDAELAVAAMTPDHAITILEKFRIHQPQAD